MKEYVNRLLAMLTIAVVTGFGERSLRSFTPFFREIVRSRGFYRALHFVRGRVFQYLRTRGGVAAK